MKDGDAIIIHRVGNGWTLMPYTANSVVSVADTLVFQDLGIAQSDTSEYGKSLLEFIARHFKQS